MDEPIPPISDELKRHLPPDPDGPARQRDLLTVGQLIDRGYDRINRRFDEVDRRFDEVDRRFDEVDRRFDEVDRKFDDVYRRFDDVYRRFDQLEALIIRESARNQEQFAAFKAETFDRMTRSYYMVLGLMVTLNGAILSFTAAVLFG